jgi:guanylate cyclase
VALLVIFVSMLQIPTAIYFWQDSGWLEIIIVFSTVILLTLIPIFNKQKRHQLARYFLILVYITDIFLSCLLWEINLNIQYFFLLAVFICPFFCSEKQATDMWSVNISFAILFMGFELWFQFVDMSIRLTLHQQIFSLSCLCLLTLSCLLCSYYIWANVNKSWQKLAIEKNRSEKLLLNILPSSIAERLKKNPKLIADYFQQVSILFADIQNFTPLCKNYSPQQLVALLNEVFCVFDNLSQKYGLEKIKTSGDGYMMAGGLPTLSENHAIRCCHCALDMQQAFQHISQKHNLNTGLRIGIGCGEVVAGVIGKHKFNYDLWGEAVNLASRMESHGLGNKIQTTQSAYDLTKQWFDFSRRGKIEVKGVGQVTTYWLVGRKQNIGAICTH